MLTRNATGAYEHGGETRDVNQLFVVGSLGTVYLVKGRVETRYALGVEKAVVDEAGDFIFIPPDMPHQSRNLTPTEPTLATLARKDPNEQ